MRVISGKARSIKLYSLEGDNTKPTKDRVKEAMFNAIQEQVKNTVFLDLFSGTGSIGIEALSRGARKVVFSDNNQDAVNVIKKNLIKTKLELNSIIIQNDYKNVLKQLANKYTFDIIFIDPPYKSNYYIESLKLIENNNLLNRKTIIILELENEKIINKEIETLNYNVKDLKKYGNSHLMFLNWKGN